MMKSENESQDVNVYITVDPASLENYQNSRRKKSKEILSCSDFIEEFGVMEYLEPFCTLLGMLLLCETIFAFTLLLMSAIPDGYHMGYEAGVYAIIANSITLAGFVLHIAMVCYWPMSAPQPHIAAILALKITMRVILLFLQVAAFIVMIACHRGHAIQTVFIVITIIYCCVLIITTFLHKEEYIRSAISRQTSATKKQKLRRGKKKGYKILSKSGYR